MHSSGSISRRLLRQPAPKGQLNTIAAEEARTPPPARLNTQRTKSARLAAERANKTEQDKAAAAAKGRRGSAPPPRRQGRSRKRRRPQPEQRQKGCRGCRREGAGRQAGRREGARATRIANDKAAAELAAKEAAETKTAGAGRTEGRGRRTNLVAVRLCLRRKPPSCPVGVAPRRLLPPQHRTVTGTRTLATLADAVQQIRGTKFDAEARELRGAGRAQGQAGARLPAGRASTAFKADGDACVEDRPSRLKVIASMTTTSEKRCRRRSLLRRERKRRSATRSGSRQRRRRSKPQASSARCSAVQPDAVLPAKDAEDEAAPGQQIRPLRGRWPNQRYTVNAPVPDRIPAKCLWPTGDLSLQQACAEIDVYHRPGGKRLGTSGTRAARGQDTSVSRQQTRLQCMPTQNCSVVRGKNHRARSPRDIHEHARDVARSFTGTEGFETSRRERKKIEMRFAHLKRILKLGRLQLRGPRGAQDEFVLAAIAQNLRRLVSWCRT